MFDLAVDREQRREKQGYVTPAQARAFLQMSRQLQLERDPAPARNPRRPRVFPGHRMDDRRRTRNRERAACRLPPGRRSARRTTADAVAAFADVLLEAGVLAPQPRALLDGPRGRRRRVSRASRRNCSSPATRDPAAYAMRSQELAYLANTIVAGCSIQARPFTAQEASDAAVAVCNLGLENWPPHWLPADARRDRPATEGGRCPRLSRRPRSRQRVPGRVDGPSRGRLHVRGRAADRVLTRLRCDDRETQAGLDELRIEMTKHWRAGAPWRARDALDVIAILDMPAWAALLGLIDECPVIHAGIGASQGSRDARGQRLGVRVHFGEQPDRVRPRVHAVAAGDPAPLTRESGNVPAARNVYSPRQEPRCFRTFVTRCAR